MSSDSELEDFYDASDQTPNVSVQRNDTTGTPDKASSPFIQDQLWLSEIEKEEQELMQMKQRADERRRREDEEIAERLAKLRKHKSNVRSTSEQTEQSSDESPTESRMMKLQRLRKQMSEDLSSISLDSPLGELCNKTLLSDVGAACEGGDDVRPDTTHRTSQNVSSKPATEPATCEESNWTDADMHEIVREVCKVASKNNSLSRDTHPANKHPKEITDISAYVLSGLRLSANASPFDEGSPDEPDIVKSTRVTPPQTLTTAPVAPPRRRKKQQTATNEDSDTGSVTPGSDSPRPMGPPTHPRPTRPSQAPVRVSSTPSDDMDHSLDVDSAIGGSRHIHTNDIEVDASNATSLSRPSSRVNSLERGVLLRKTSTESSNGALADPILSRPRSNSGRSLTDKEILDAVMVLNLDTGEQVPLSVAEEKLPQCVNPLALHIMRRTKEYTSHSSLNKGNQGSDDDYDAKSEGGRSTNSLEFSAKFKAEKLKKLIGKGVKSSVKKVKQVAEQSKKGIAEVLEGDDTEMENEVSVDGKKFKFKRSRGNKGPYSFSQFRILQELSGHTGAVWTMKFSPCGRLLATGGQDNLLRVWVIKSSYTYFDDMRIKCYDANKISPAQSEDCIDSQSMESFNPASDPSETDDRKSFMKKPLWVYRGHTADLLDIAWSKNNFILSSSMDKTVRLWHISRRECLCTFQHIDFVTAIVFHPRDDRYFLSGSLDGNLRLWNIPDKKVTLRNEVSGQSSLITTANFCDDGRYAVVGMYDGRCLLFHTDKLKYYTQINVRSTRGKNRGRKITGVEPIRLNKKNLMLITSNDSRIRLYDLRDLTLTCKFKGHINNSSQIKASFSGSGQSIICGSEDHFVYVWKTQHDYQRMSSARRDRNHYWEAIKVHNAVVTTAIFASKPELFSKPKEDSRTKDGDCTASTMKESKLGGDLPREIIVSADFNGLIKIVQNPSVS